MSLQKSRMIRPEDLLDFDKKVLQKHGMSAQDATIMGQILTDTDCYGIQTHGNKNLKLYVEKMDLGKLNPKAKPELIHEFGALALFDAHDCAGFISGYVCMNKAVELAKQFGIGYVTVKNSCHMGAIFNYPVIAAKAGMFGFTTTNTDPNMAVPGGRTRIIGNNPFSFALPVKDSHPVVLDIALSQVAALRIFKAKGDGVKIPDTWMVDPDGTPTTDPAWFEKGGALLPMSAHKGYGLSMLMESLTAIASGGLIVRDIHGWCFDMQTYNRVCHAFIAIDLDRMQNGDAKAQARDYVDYILNSPKAKGNNTLRVPGMAAWAHYDKAYADGLELGEDVVASMLEQAQKDNLAIKWMD